METRIALLEDAELSVRSERVRHPPRGRAGGDDGVAGTQYVEDGAGGRRSVPAKVANFAVREGETFVIKTSGGGGLGQPVEKDV